MINKHFINRSISTIPDIPVDTDFEFWLSNPSNGFINTATHTVTQSKDGEKELISSNAQNKILADKDKTGVEANVMTGAGYTMQTTVDDIEREKKGDSFEAKQGIVYENKVSILKAATADTKVIWKPAVGDDENGSASLISAFGAIFFGVATLAF